MRIAYLTGEYPRVTDTFIQREVAALRHHGAANATTVHTFSVRSPKSTASLNQAQKEERDRTSYLLPAKPKELLSAHWHLLIAQPKRYFQALALAWKTRQLGVRGTLYQLIYFLEAGILAQRLHRQEITHLHNHFGDSSCTVAMLASALGDFSYSFTLHGPGIFFEPHRWRLDEKISRAKFVSCISYFCRSQTMIFAPLSAWPNLHIIHCGLDPQQFAAETSAAATVSADVSTDVSVKNAADSVLADAVSAGLSAVTSVIDLAETGSSDASAAGQRLLYVGRLAAAKGLPILLQSLATLKVSYPNIRLTVVGDGPDRAELTSQVQTLQLTQQVNFVGYQSPESVRRYLQAADVFVMSSFAEGVPVVLMEAMMSGLPVVATQIAGVSELVEEGINGFLVPPSDREALCDRIQRLLADSDLRQRLGSQGKLKVAREFNIYHETQKLYQLMVPVASQTKPLAKDLACAVEECAPHELTPCAIINNDVSGVKDVSKVNDLSKAGRDAADLPPDLPPDLSSDLPPSLKPTVGTHQ
jgi:colanic acid/amylovoran biosynthesis glycosyltransferase